MYLPPRVKTQQATLKNVEQPTPIPLETVFFLNDGRRDKAQPNKYYFDYPGNWVTSNNGEIIIGLRSIKMQRTTRKLEFTLSIVKYLFESYFRLYNEESIGTFTKDLTIEYLLRKDVQLAQRKDISVVCWVSPEDYDYDILFYAIHNTLKTYINNGWQLYGSETFKQSDVDPMDRDVQLEGFYLDNKYHVRIYSERNDNTRDDDYEIQFKLLHANDEFKDLLNIDDALLKKYNNEWQEQLLFSNVWDLQPSNVFSSLAEQCPHHYIGTTEQEYSTIKYFKINSTDQQFWIEFYSMSNSKCPSIFPKNTSFRLEVQFQSFNKNLNI